MRYLIGLIIVMAFNFSAYGAEVTARVGLSSRIELIKIAKKNGFIIKNITETFERYPGTYGYIDYASEAYQLENVIALDDNGNQIEVTAESANKLCDTLFSGSIPLWSKKFELGSLMFLEDQAFISCE